MAKRLRENELDPSRSVRDEFYPKGRKRGIVVRIQVDYSRSGRLLRYSLSLIDTRSAAVDYGQVLGYDNAHGYSHRHSEGRVEPVEFKSYEETEKRFEAEVRKYLDEEDGQSRS